MAPGRDIRVPIGFTLVLTCLTVWSALVPHALSVSPATALNSAACTASLVIAVGSGYVFLSEFRDGGSTTSLLTGIAMALLAGANAGMGLLPLIGGWSERLRFVPYGWSVQWLSASALLLAAGLLGRRVVLPARRSRAVLAGLVFALWLSGTVTLTVYFLAGQPEAAWLHVSVRLVAGAGLLGAAVGYWSQSRGGDNHPLPTLSLCLVLAGFVQFAYAVHPYEPHRAHLADFLQILFYLAVMLVLGAQAVAGYGRLRSYARELASLQALLSPANLQEVTVVIEHVTRVTGEALRAHCRVILLREPGAGEESNGTPPEETGLHGYGHPSDPCAISVQLDGGHMQLGRIEARRQEDDPFSSDDLRLLALFARHASALLERSLLYEEVAAGAIIEERSRLAREIHDGLAQHLAFLKMRVAWLQRSPLPVEPKSLRDMEAVLEAALAEARQAITTLRADLGHAGLAQAIAEYALHFSEASGLHLSVEQGDEIPAVAPRARVELLRIVQEALNNVRKHAGARQVRVRTEVINSAVCVTISDDGSGFSATAGGGEHFGLDIMTERAESIGGSLKVETTPGSGTVVQVQVPIGRDVPEVSTV